jgi:hypothetical protein
VIFNESREGLITIRRKKERKKERQSAGTTKAALGLMRRMVLHDIKKDKRTGG